MKGKMRGKWKRKGDTGKLQKYMVLVDEFVQSKAGGGETEEDDGNRLIKSKSRRQLRKEKRKLKKLQMKNYYEGNKHFNQCPMPISISDVDESEKAKTVKKKNKTANDDSKKAHKTTLDKNEMKNSKAHGAHTSKGQNQSKETATKKKSRLQETRKQALLEANAAEDKEIKKLERYLGLNKRKNKKTLPQSFAADGLDYILGALEPGLSASGMYESDEEMEVTDVQDQLKKLEGSDSDDNDNSDGAEEQEDSDSDDDDTDNPDSDKDADEMDDGEDVDAEDGSGEASECEDEEQDREETGEDTTEMGEPEDDASHKVLNIRLNV